MGATALQARVPSRPTSFACNWHEFKGGWTPEPIKVATPPSLLHLPWQDSANNNRQRFAAGAACANALRWH